ncbi:glucose dehydrogenase [FAD, quinone]-like [Leptidea sinapis]|uniref:glucose dehydrogenase [FAD, quinone]-like n=1 Tax=Leptidea sinapis TaxID=189913 RepID=UPI0021465478|nr:glucose dehydrogenase [FAD, quinone]-like [Leptidea sinapis]
MLKSAVLCFAILSNTVNSDYGKNGRIYWSEFNNTMENGILDALSGLLPERPESMFDFLSDSYPLPGNLKQPYSEYDFVIVGAGSAGCALAQKLSKNRNTTVLLIEAGRPEMLFTDVPALAPYFQSTDYVWHYYMEPQPGVCLGMDNQRCFWPRGKAVGGSSVVNYMIYTRGRPREWDRIAADGNYGWSYDDVLKYFLEMEKAKLDGYEKNPYRSRDGETPVEFVPIKTKLLDAFLEAGNILGHPTVDYNAPNELGFGKVQVTMSNSRRQSAAKVYLHSHKNRKNLHVLAESRATKILIDPVTKQAYGIEYVRNKLLHTVYARKEVIISAGPIASPQLLMLSGIGPRNHLSEMGIPLVQDLLVGRNLYDHISFPGIIFTLNETNISFSENRATGDLANAISWMKGSDSFYSTPGGVEGIGYIKTPISDDPDQTVPDIELISIGGSILSDGGNTGSKAIRKGMRLSESLITETYGPIDDTDTWSAIPMLLHPKSVGHIELRNNNPYSHPKLYGNYLSQKHDVATFIAAIRHVQQLAATPPFQRFGAKLYPVPLRNCQSFTFDSDEYWECAVRTLTATLHHQVATCRMGPDNDPGAVVDPELRVRGIYGLRVVDTSVIPRTISAHTHAPGTIIGLKAADLIKTSWNIN